MRIPLPFLFFAALTCTGCGGNSVSAPHTPSVTPAIKSSPTPNQPAIQTAVQTATAAINSVNFQIGLYNGTSGAPLIPKPITTNILADGKCHGSKTLTKSIIASTETDTLSYFYDIACAQPERVIVAVVTGEGTTNEQIQRTSTTYNRAGTKLAVRSATYTIINGSPAGAYSATLLSTLTAEVVNENETGFCV